MGSAVEKWASWTTQEHYEWLHNFKILYKKISFTPRDFFFFYKNSKMVDFSSTNSRQTFKQSNATFTNYTFFFLGILKLYYEWSVCWMVMYFLFKRNLGWGHCLGNWKINVLIAVIIVQKFLNTKLRSFLRSSLNE